MTVLTTKLVKDGNSVAVRIPKTALVMSGLKQDVHMEVKHGQIVLRPAGKARVGWKQRIDRIAATQPSAHNIDSELDAWEVTSNDGLK